jgi:hypothetical protein
MKKAMFLLGLMIALFACKKVDSLPQPTSTPTTSETTTPQKECYAYNGNGSNIQLQIVQNGNQVAGTLMYALAEKDHNAGTIKGKLENNILLADYTFRSEGIESTRQVIFQFKNKQFVEGYGEMTADGTHFKDPTKVTFTSTMTLSQVDCSE